MSKRPIIYPPGPSLAYVPLTQGMFARIDTDDIALVSPFNWYAAWHPGTRSFYAYTNQRVSSGFRTLNMHRLVLGLPEGVDVDHVAHETLDNRRPLLRISTHQQNCFNQRAPKHSRSGLKGAQWDAQSGRWRSSIRVDGKTKHIGRFNTAEEAHAAYVEVATRTFGEFTCP